MQHFGVIVGSDQSQEWLLPWWWDHYASHNSYPVHFIDFGMSPKALAWCKDRSHSFSLKSDPTSPRFKKPLALLASPFSYSLWLDLDCQVLGSLEPLFNAIAFGDIGLVREDDGIHRQGRESGYLLDTEVNYNSGVVISKKNSPILHKWAEMSKTGKFLDDQYALARAIHQSSPPLIELPALYNWPDTFGPNDQAIIRHFHGVRGKLAILNRLHQN